MLRCALLITLALTVALTKATRSGRASSRALAADRLEAVLLSSSASTTAKWALRRYAPYCYLLSQMSYPEFPLPLGVFRAVEKAPYDALATAQVAKSRAEQGNGEIKKLLHSAMTWQVGPDGKPV